MIIRLSPGFDALSTTDLSANIDVFERLLQCHWDGIHIFIPRRSILSWVIRHGSGFSETQRACAREINANLSLYSGLAKDAQITVSVRPDNASDLKEYSNDNIRVRIGDLRNTGSLERFHLLVENAQRDGHFYRILCQCLAKDAGYDHAFEVAFLHGGGGTLGQEYRRAGTSFRPVLCVVDSDRCGPIAPLGDTANGVERAAAALRRAGAISPFLAYFVLPLREAENIVPLEICADIFRGNGDVQATIERLRRLEAHDENRPAGEEFMRWFDLKAGLRRTEFARPDCTSSRDFLMGMWRALFPAEPNFEVENFAPHDEIICAGVSAQLVERFNTHVTSRAISARVTAQIRRRPFYQELLDLVAWILALAAHPQRSRG